MKSIKVTIFAVLVALFSSSQMMAQMSNDSIVADFNEFVRILEETHPDPYTNYGSRPYFRLAAMETRFGLVQDSVTDPNVLADRIKEFLVPLRDGHTGIRGGSMGSGNDTRAFIRFNAINEGIITVEALPTEHESLLGSKLLGIEDMPIQDVLDGLAKYYTAENEIGRMINICWENGFRVDLGLVIPNLREDSITYHLETPQGEQVALTLPRMTFDKIKSTPFSRPPRTDIFPNKNLTYDFVGTGKNTMYLCSKSIMARDCFEFMRDNGWDYLDRLKYMYWGKEMPSDPNEAIAQLPSFSEEFEKMLLEMKKNKTKNLIIDLRGNDGGFTPITIPTLYQMWGDEYIKKSSTFDTEGFTMISPLWMKKYNKSLEQINAESPFKFEYGDVEYSVSKAALSQVTDEYRNRVVSQMMSSIKDKLMAQKGEPVYTPEHVYVLTDPGTFSAAFHYAFFLSKMGATIVGVTSSQAPNTYMELTPFELPRTGLKGNISNSLQLFLPVNDPRAKDFTPDLMPTYEDYKRYNFDDNTIPMYLMDIIEKQQ